MGFWSWLFGSISEPNALAPTEPGCRRSPGDSGGAVTAVAERPEPPSEADPGDPDGTFPWWTPQPESRIEPCEPRLPDPAGDALALENLLVSYFDGHDLTMPTLHHVAERVLPKLRGSTCDLVAISRDIAEDQVLTAAVLRTVNSPMYRGTEKISSVQRAVTRLGVRPVRALLMHQSLRSAVFDRRGGVNQFAEMLWRRSLASACIMQGLARLTGVDEEESYLIGLLHDIGSIIVLRILCAEEKGGFVAMDLDTFEYLCQQSHQEFGELIANAWTLPPDVKALIAAHHVHPESTDPLRIQRLMLILTDMIASILRFAPPEDYNLIQCRAAVDLGLTGRSSYTDWLTALPSEIDGVVAEL